MRRRLLLQLIVCMLFVNPLENLLLHILILTLREKLKESPLMRWEFTFQIWLFSGWRKLKWPHLLLKRNLLLITHLRLPPALKIQDTSLSGLVNNNFKSLLKSSHKTQQFLLCFHFHQAQPSSSNLLRQQLIQMISLLLFLSMINRSPWLSAQVLPLAQSIHSNKQWLPPLQSQIPPSNVRKNLRQVLAMLFEIWLMIQ